MSNACAWTFPHDEILWLPRHWWIISPCIHFRTNAWSCTTRVQCSSIHIHNDVIHLPVQLRTMEHRHVLPCSIPSLLQSQRKVCWAVRAVTSKQADPIHQCTDSWLSEILGTLKVDAQHMSLKQCPGLHLWKIMVLGAVICPVHCASCQMDIPTEMLMCHSLNTPPAPRWMARTTKRPKRCFTSIPSCSLAS